MCRIKVEHPREIIPVSVENDLAGRDIGAHPLHAGLVVIRRLAVCDIFGSSTQIEEQGDAQSYGNNGSGKSPHQLFALLHPGGFGRLVSVKQLLQLVDGWFRETRERR